MTPHVLLLFAAAAAAAAPPAPSSGPGRDPFVSPTGIASDPTKGLAGMAWQSLQLTGIVDAPSGPIATLGTEQGDSFVAQEGDRLANASVVTIDRDRRAVLLRMPATDNVAGFREVVLRMGAKDAIVREPHAAEPALKASEPRPGSR